MTSSYRGFPYVTPIVTEAPSLTAEEISQLAKWRNLPKKQLTALGQAQGSSANKPSTASDTVTPRVYIDLPYSGTSGQVSTPSRPSGSRELDETLVLYIDIPKTYSTTLNSGGNSSQSKPSVSRARPFPHNDLEDRPVLYIDIPESNGSEVSETREEEPEPEFVQETIFYDPFKDKRIDVPSSDEDTGSSNLDRTGPDSSRSLPPRTLNLTSAGSCSGYDSSTSTIPPMLSKEAYIYGRQPTPDDGFSLTPLPLQSYPASPPPYEEIDRDRGRVQIPGSQSTGSSQTPPRTQVITSVVTPVAPVILDGQRKLLTCHHCQNTVQTLVVKENGFWTHALAIIIFPLVVLVYCCSCFQYSNHYCPSCNKKVGYRSPLSCDDSITLAFDS